jgi:anti-sigma factor RsiW
VDGELGNDERQELLSAYALDALDEDDRLAVEELLATDPAAREEVRRQREVATLLGLADATAPPELWARIAASIEGTTTSRTEAPEAGRARRARRQPTWLLPSGIAAAVLLIAGLLAVIGLDHHRDGSAGPAVASDGVQQLFARAAADPQSRMATLASGDGVLTVRAVVQPDGTGYLAAQSLPALAGGDYQLWGVIGGRAVSLGVLGGRPGWVAFMAAGDVQALAITQERLGGVTASQRTPIVAGPLT